MPAAPLSSLYSKKRTENSVTGHSVRFSGPSYFGIEGTADDVFATRGPSNQLYRSVLSRTKWIMTASFDQTVRMWDASTGQPVGNNEGMSEPTMYVVKTK